MAKPRVATTSLCGCFGCHMSILDIDERILKLAEIVDFDRSPIDDIKHISQRCAVGLIVVISLGDCAISGGVPAMRNMVPLEECLEEAYIHGPSVHNPAGRIPNDVEIPLLLDKVYPAHEVVKIDYHLPGCPPPADTIWEALVALLSDKPLDLPYALIKYD